MRIFKVHHVVLIVSTAIIIPLFLLVPSALAQNDQAPYLQPTPFPTPTPGPNGIIVYIVKDGDTLWRVAAIAGITLEELMAMNGIQPGDFISPGMQLELGRGGPVEPTSAPASPRQTATSSDVTPTPITGTGEICILLFLDRNGNSKLEEGEEPISGGQLSVVNVSGVLVGEFTTDTNIEGHCFSEMESGDYNVSAAVPVDFNPTTGLNVPVSLNPGDIKYLQFGAQPSSAIENEFSGDGSGRSALLGIVGVVLLLFAGGLAVYASRMGRKTPSSLR
jgi:LysM repeat protein